MLALGPKLPFERLPTLRILTLLASPASCPGKRSHIAVTIYSTVPEKGYAPSIRPFAVNAAAKSENDDTLASMILLPD